MLAGYSYAFQPVNISGTYYRTINGIRKYGFLPAQTKGGPLSDHVGVRGPCSLRCCVI